ncbi:hypothetical protein [Dapis sp. BLCC M229]|uniref:hypothetical protein n=1 Tax=Dapis sp. BLCC M229 TaxID=3400188 RepID=UPI003CF7C073
MMKEKQLFMDASQDENIFGIALGKIPLTRRIFQELQRMKIFVLFRRNGWKDLTREKPPFMKSFTR